MRGIEDHLQLNFELLDALKKQKDYYAVLREQDTTNKRYYDDNIRNFEHHIQKIENERIPYIREKISYFIIVNGIFDSVESDYNKLVADLNPLQPIMDQFKIDSRTPFDIGLFIDANKEINRVLERVNTLLDPENPHSMSVDLSGNRPVLEGMKETLESQRDDINYMLR